MQWKTSRPPFPLASPPLQGLQGGHNPHPHPPGQLERLTSDLLTTHIWGQADWWLFRAESACDYLAGRALSCSVRVPPWGREDVNWREREREREWSATPWGTTGGPAYWTSSGEGTRRTRGTNQPAVRGESCSSLLTFPSVWLSADDYLCHQLYSSVLSVQCWIFYFWIVWIFKASNFNEIHKMLSSYEKNLWKKNK